MTVDPDRWQRVQEICQSDGRFLMIQPHPDSPAGLVFVQNWFSELQQRVPTR